MTLLGSVVRFVLERRAANANLVDIRGQLETSAGEVTARFENAADTPANRAQAAHIIGMERWGTHRLHTTAGAPYIQDEYDGYRPASTLSMPVLLQEFRSTRAETLALVDKLYPFADQKVPHNSFGPFSVPAWLMYLNTHAAVESRKLKAN